MKNQETDKLLVAGASSYPQALAAINEFRRTVEQIVRESVEHNLKNIASSMGIVLSASQLIDYTRPSELGASIDGENAILGVHFRMEEQGWRSYFAVGWESSRLYCSASIWFRDAQLGKKVFDAMTKTSPKYLGGEKGEAWLCRWMEPDEISHLPDLLEDVIQEWIGVWQRLGGVKPFLPK